MPKSKALKRTSKATALQSAPYSKANILATPPAPTTPNISSSFHDIIHPDDLQITIETLQSLTQRPALIKSKLCKDLRNAVYEFKQASTTGLNGGGTSLTACISAALTDGKYLEARILLSEMRIRQETPKLGALCRWVRDLDVTSGLSGPKMSADLREEVDTRGKRELWRVLDAILRTTTREEEKPQKVKEERGVGSFSSGAGIVVREKWDLRTSGDRGRVYESVLDKSIVAPHRNLPSNFRVIETTAGPDRRPPNTHPAILYTCEDDTISLTADNSNLVSRVAHPKVPNLSLLHQVLSDTECDQIISAAESIGFTPDAPIPDIDAPKGQGTSVLAHNFYWVTDPAFIDRLWKRVKDSLPQRVEGKLVRGLNRRFRIYRYVPGAEYRCHIDGAWPPSGIDPATGKYIYDASSATAKQHSLFTFLIYLNDEFEGGETTFFLPNPSREGVIDAYPVKPVRGCAAVFPHGEGWGSILHEGTGVRERPGEEGRSAKYIIRTDVVYDVDAGLET